MKKFLIILAIFTGLAFAQYDGGTGTSGDPYLISTTTQFISAISTGDAANYFYITADTLDFDGITWPNTTWFPRGLDGDSVNRPVIANVTISKPDYAGNNISLFQNVFNTDGYMKNIIYYNTTITASIFTLQTELKIGLIGETTGTGGQDGFLFQKVVVDSMTINITNTIGNTNRGSNFVYVAAFIAKHNLNNLRINNCIIRKADIQYTGPVIGNTASNRLQISGFLARSNSVTPTIFGSYVEDIYIHNIAPAYLFGTGIENLFVSPFATTDCRIHDAYATGFIDVDDPDFKVAGFIVGDAGSSDTYAIYTNVKTQGSLADSVFAYGWDIQGGPTGSVFANSDSVRPLNTLYQSDLAVATPPQYKTSAELKDTDTYLLDAGPNKFNFTDTSQAYVWAILDYANNGYPVMLNNLYKVTPPSENTVLWDSVKWYKNDVLYFEWKAPGDSTQSWTLDSTLTAGDSIYITFTSTTPEVEINGDGAGSLSGSRTTSPIGFIVPNITSPTAPTVDVSLEALPYTEGFSLSNIPSYLTYSLEGTKAKFITITNFQEDPDSAHQGQLLVQGISRRIEQYSIQSRWRVYDPKNPANPDTVEGVFEEILYVDLVARFNNAANDDLLRDQFGNYFDTGEFAYGYGTIDTADTFKLDSLDYVSNFKHYFVLEIPDTINRKYNQREFFVKVTETTPRNKSLLGGKFDPGFNFIKERWAIPSIPCNYNSASGGTSKWIEDKGCGASPGYFLSTLGYGYGVYTYSTFSVAQANEGEPSGSPSSYWSFNGAWGEWLGNYNSINPGNPPVVPNQVSETDWSISQIGGTEYWQISYLDGDATITLYTPVNSGESFGVFTGKKKLTPGPLYARVSYTDDDGVPQTATFTIADEDEVDQSLIFGGNRATASKSPATYLTLFVPKILNPSVGYNIVFWDYNVEGPGHYMQVTKPKEYFQLESDVKKISPINVKVVKYTRDYFRGIHPKIWKYGQPDGVKR